jgi:hypothetical protein
LRDVVILTVEATEVTAGTGNRKTLGAWMKMIEWLLLNGVDGQRTRFAIHLTKEYAAIIAPTATATCLAIGDMAVMRTELTLHCIPLQSHIIPALNHSSLFT